MTAITDARRRALTILKEHGPMRPATFAKYMWPNSDGHQRYTKCGPNGVSVGGGMRLAAGGYLGKLLHAGLVWYKSNYEYSISVEGVRALKETDDE